jgi:hypothetical protein
VLWHEKLLSSIAEASKLLIMEQLPAFEDDILEGHSHFHFSVH